MAFRNSLCASAFAVLLPLAGANLSLAQGATDNFVDDDSILVDNDTAVDRSASDGSATMEDALASFNTTLLDSLNETNQSSRDSILSSPATQIQLDGVVSDNYVDVYNDAYDYSEITHHDNGNVKIDNGSFTGFTGVNSMNLNAGDNSLQQSGVAISVVSIN